MHGQTRIEFIFSVVIFMVVVIYIINQINYKLSSFVSDYEIDSMKARALVIIKFLVETGDIEKHYTVPVPVDVVMVNDVSGSMDGAASGWGGDCKLNCNTFGSHVCSCSSGCPDKCADCDGDGWYADAGESPCAINDAKDAMSTFLDLLNTTEDQAGVVIFNQTARVHQNLSTDLETVKNSINSIHANTHANTQIEYGLRNATKELETRGRNIDGRWIEILLTDGRDDPCCTNPESAARDAVTKNITIYTIGLGEPNYPLNETLLKNVANITGGKYYNAPTGNDLINIYQQIAYEIKTEKIIVGLITKQPYNVSQQKIDELNQDCDRLNAFDIKTYRLKIYNSTDLLLFCGFDSLKPPVVSVSKIVLIENNLGNITLDLW